MRLRHGLLLDGPAAYLYDNLDVVGELNNSVRSPAIRVKGIFTYSTAISHRKISVFCAEPHTMTQRSTPEPKEW